MTRRKDFFEEDETGTGQEIIERLHRLEDDEYGRGDEEESPAPEGLRPRE